METVSNITSAASRAIWGDPAKNDASASQEPVSGELGNTQAGEPYDKGNEESLSTTEPKSLSTTSKENEPQDTSSATSKTSNISTSSTAAEVGADAQQTALEKQGADRPAENPSSSKAQKIAETENEAKEADEAAAVDVSGAGPASLEDKSGAGAITSVHNGPQKETQGPERGENHAKSSGLATDAGNYDTAKPGAVKDADYLKETTGVQHGNTTQTSPNVKSKDLSASSDDKVTEGVGKVSLKDKIKAKLHKHKD